MAYVHRVVKAGPCVEHKKMQSFRVHTKGVKRGPNTGHTTAKQERINEKDCAGRSTPISATGISMLSCTTTTRGEPLNSA